MKNRRVTTIKVYNDAMYECVGRCIGLLNSEEYNALILSKEIQRKLTNVATVSLAEIATVPYVKGLRLSVVIDKTENGKKKLFVTEPIEMISQYKAPSIMSMVGKDGAYVEITETKDS